MIVYKTWETGIHYEATLTNWDGWFLFGIIPLYIRRF